MKNILIVDDDRHIRHLVSVHLEAEGFHVLQAGNGVEALALMEREACDLAVVDVMMPKMDGYALTKEIRECYDIPIILLTAKGQLKDKETGFRSGTDDYLVKPFEPKELLFRIKALFRRYEKNTDDELQIGSTTISRKTYEVRVGKRNLMLPLKEFDLLFLLASYPGQVFSRENLIERVWGMDFEGDERTVDVHIKRLRERFTAITDDFRIKTIRGIGYALESNK